MGGSVETWVPALHWCESRSVTSSFWTSWTRGQLWLSPVLTSKAVLESGRCNIKCSWTCWINSK